MPIPGALQGRFISSHSVGYEFCSGLAFNAAGTEAFVCAPADDSGVLFRFALPTFADVDASGSLDGPLETPLAIRTTARGTLLMINLGGCALVEVTPACEVLRSFVPAVLNESNPVTGIAVHGDTVVATSPKSVHFIDYASGAEMRRLDGATVMGRPTNFTSVDFSPDGTQLVVSETHLASSGSGADVVSVILVSNGLLVRQYGAGTLHDCRACTMAPNGDVIACDWVRPHSRVQCFSGTSGEVAWCWEGARQDGEDHWTEGFTVATVHNNQLYVLDANGQLQVFE